MMNNTNIASITVTDQAYRAECKMPARIAQGRDTNISILGDRVSFTWNDEPHDLPISMCGVAYARPIPEAKPEAMKAHAVVSETAKAKPAKGRPGRKPGFKVAAKKEGAATVGAVSVKRPVNGTLNAN